MTVCKKVPWTKNTMRCGGWETIFLLIDTEEGATLGGLNSTIIEESEVSTRKFPFTVPTRGLDLEDLANFSLQCWRPMVDE